MKNFFVPTACALISCSCATNNDLPIEDLGNRSNEFLEQAVIDKKPPSHWKSALFELRKRKAISKYNADSILAEEVYIGMPEKYALMSWGRPNDINSTTNAYGSHEQWVYGDYYYSTSFSYLYLENGKVETIQN